jgi:hydroxyacylglutathione hydrolase
MTISRSPYQSTRVADGIFCYVWQGRGNNCNSVVLANVLKGGKTHVLIDPGHINDEVREPCFDLLVNAMAQDKIKVEDVGLVINTHAHPDHCEADGLVIERSGAVVTMSKAEDEYRRSFGSRWQLDKAPYLTPLFYLDEGNLQVGTQGPSKIEVFITPGHTPGSVCLYWPEQKLIVTGDVVFYGSVGRTDMPGGSQIQLKKSIERLSALDVEVLVSGHSTEYGAIITGKQNVVRNFQSIKLLVQ